MKKLFGFLFFVIGATALILSYLIKANLVALSSVPFMNFVFQSHNNLIVSVVAFVILLLIGLLMIGRIGVGIILLFIGLVGVIFPLLTKYDVVAVPNSHIFQLLLKNNFYITILIGFVIFAVGIFMLTLKKRKG